MGLRIAMPGDEEAVIRLYKKTVDRMTEERLQQWKRGVYPTEELLREDIAEGRLYLLEQEGRLSAGIAVCCRPDPEYAEVHWSFGVKPGILHRLAVDPDLQGQGLGAYVLDDALALLREKGCDCARCDTLAENRRAVRLYENRMGFRRCGWIRWPGDERDWLCFEKPLQRETPMLPIPMTPAFRGGALTPWGGEKLRTLFGKEIQEVPTGESLEVSCIPGLESRDPMGRLLPELIAEFGSQLVGRYAERPFPLLLKLIDAREALSVQVHPDDAYAAANENGKLGKNEAWLILDAPEGAELVYGIRPGTSREALQAACEAGSAVEPLLRRVPVRAGDICYIPAGCVHAIGAGITLYEIQESSDITYRFYDWDRTDAQGRKRQLHLKQALDVTRLRLEPRPIRAERAEGIKRVLSEACFTLDLIRPGRPVRLPEIRNFGLLTALEGEIRLEWEGGALCLRKGETCLLPASLPRTAVTGCGSAALSMPA